MQFWGLPCNAGDPGSVSGQRSRYHMLQLKIPYAAAKTEDPMYRN